MSSLTSEMKTLPTWFASRQEQAAAKIESLTLPSRRVEAWRFGSLKKLNLEEFKGQDSFSLIAEPTAHLEETAARFVFANDQLISQTGLLPEGAICLSLREALEAHPELVEKHFMQQEVKLGSARYAAIHESRVQDGVFLYLPENVKLTAPVEIQRVIGGEKAVVFPHTLIVTQEGAKAEVLETFLSADDASPAWVLAVADLAAGPRSELTYAAVQDLNSQSRMIQINETSVDEEATLKSFLLSMGAEWARQESCCRLLGKGAHSDMLAISVPSGTQEFDQRTFQHHVSPGAYSDLLYKNTLHDKSKTVFSGLIFVDEDAHDTDAYQTCRNLLMSDESEANSMPGLEINADQVKCSHGSTSSQISDDEIFYLQARGIDPLRARQMIAKGFSMEVIEKIGNEAIEKVLVQYLDQAFSRVA